MSQIPDPTPGNASGSTPPSNATPPPAAAPLGYAGPGTAAPPYTGPEPTPDDRTMALLCFVLGIVSAWLGPLIIWLIKKDTSPFVNDQGKEVLNWEISIFIGYVAAMVIGCIPFIHLIGLLAMLAIFVANIVFCVMGAMQANQGKAYRYPFSVRLIN